MEFLKEHLEKVNFEKKKKKNLEKLAGMQLFSGYMFALFRPVRQTLTISS